MSESTSVTRRNFLTGMAATGASLATARLAAAETAPAVISDATAAANSAEELRIALIGAGYQGRNLIDAIQKDIPNIRIVAVCDIWSFNLTYTSRRLKSTGIEVNTYTDFMEMLDKEKDLDAVLIATPDFLHAPMTCAALKKGVNVYCEKEMSNSLEASAQMVSCQRETGKILQIGHQRRSNPLYRELGYPLIHKEKYLGQVTHVYGQWVRCMPKLLEVPKGYDIPQDVLDKSGYGNMNRFRNWRWFREFGGGLMADLGSHQVDVYNWFLQARPKKITVSGGQDFFKDDREFPDNVMATYEYDTQWGPVHAFYQVLSTTSYGGYFERFMGTEGTLVISEDTTKGFLYKELEAPKREWEEQAKKTEGGDDNIALVVGQSKKGEGKAMGGGDAAPKQPHSAHLENFFLAVRENKPELLNCPADVAYETAVTVLKAETAFEHDNVAMFSPSEFKV